jgi:hypothetical protein
MLAYHTEVLFLSFLVEFGKCLNEEVLNEIKEAFQKENTPGNKAVAVVYTL